MENWLLLRSFSHSISISFNSSYSTLLFSHQKPIPNPTKELRHLRIVDPSPSSHCPGVYCLATAAVLDRIVGRRDRAVHCDDSEPVCMVAPASRMCLFLRRSHLLPDSFTAQP